MNDMGERDDDMRRLIRVPDWFSHAEEHFAERREYIRQKFESAAEAEAFASQYGVTAIYGDRLDIAEMANTLLIELDERTLPKPLTILTTTSVFERMQDDWQRAVAMTENGVIFLNPAAPLWNTPVSVACLLYSLGYWSTPHPLHAVYHEAGHLAQENQTSRQKKLTAREVSKADAVSVRAKQDADEFVAEVFVGLLTGVQYDADILRMYRRFGGKTL